MAAALIFSFAVLCRGRGHLVPGRGDPDAGRRRDLRVLDRLLLVSFASSVGATLAFLSARFLLRDFVQGSLATA